MKINQLKIGVVLSYATQVIQILSGLIYTPIMLRLLGQSEYGLYQLVYSVVSYLSLLSMGFGSAYMRFYARYSVKNDDDGVAKLNGMFLAIFSVISIICLLCGLVMITNSKAIFGDGLTSAELQKAKILMAIMVLNLAVSFMNSVFQSNITAHEQFFFQRLVQFLKALFNPFLTLPLLLLGFGSVGMVTITTALTVSVFISDIIFCKKKLKIKFKFKDFNFPLLKEMWIFTFFIFINMIVDQLNWSVDKFLLGRFMGTVAVAVYGVASQLNAMYMTFSCAISGVFIPRVNFIVSEKEDDKKLTDIFTRVGRVQFILIALIILGYIFFGQAFIGYWAGTGYEDAYIIGIYLMIPVSVPLIQNLGIEIQRAKNMHKARSIVYLFIAISNIFVSIPCIKLWGTKGAAIGTAISLLVGNGLFMNLYYHKKIGLDIIYFWKEIMKFTPALIIPIILGTAVMKYVAFSGIFMLGGAIIAYVIIYCISMWFLGMNNYERGLISAPIKRLLGKEFK